MLNSEKMVASLERQDLAHAQKYFERALETDSSEVLCELATYLESIGFLPQAKQIYLKERETYPELNINLAEIAAEDGDIEEAFLYLSAISSDSEAYVSALLVMADLYDMEGLTDVAREKLVEASRLSQDPFVIFGLAEIELSLGHDREAISHYATLDNREILAETGISTYQRIGRCYANLGKFEAAIEFLEKSLEIAYDDTTVYELAMLNYDQDEYQKAIIYYKQLDTMNPEFMGYELGYALALREEHRGEEALRMVQKGLSKNSFDEQLLRLAAKLAYEQHDSHLAESYLMTAREIASEDEEIVLALVTLYLEQERYEDVLALESDDLANPLTLWGLAKAYHATETDDASLERYATLLEYLGDNPEFLQDYTYLLREYGRFDEARAIGRRYLELVPDDLDMAQLIEE